MSVKLLYSSEWTNSFYPTPWHFSVSPFPAYRGAGARYNAFLAVAQDYAPAFAGAVPSADGYSCSQVSFDTAPSKLITTRDGQKLLLVPRAPEFDELTLLLTLRGGFRGRYSRIGAVGAEILLDRNSEPRNVHCCPTRHLVVRLTHPNGYVFAETGRRCGTGLVEVFSWRGYRTFATEEFEVWHASLAPDTSEETRAAACAEFETARLKAVEMREVAAKAAAVAEAARHAAQVENEEASRKALAGFLPRLEALQARLQALRVNSPGVAYCELQIGETHFVFIGGPKLYTEANVVEAERNVAYWEQQLATRQQRVAMIPRFEVFAPRLSTLGLSFRFGDDQATWVGGYGNFSYDEAGLAACEAALVRQEEAAAEKVRQEAAAAVRLEAEADAKASGLPSDVSIWRRMGGVTNRGNGWVVRPDGSRRDADYNPSQGDLVWNQILPGELVLRYYRTDNFDIAHCEVVYRPDEITAAQLATAKQIEEEMGASENAFGLDDRLSALLNRRKEAIQAAMAELPVALRPAAWDYQVLVSENGISLDTSSAGWVDYAAPFDTSCEGRRAQVVFSHPAADGVLQAVAYDKWGGWNLNLRWHEDATVAEVTAASHAEEELDMATALKQLRTKYSK